MFRFPEVGRALQSLRKMTPRRLGILGLQRDFSQCKMRMHELGKGQPFAALPGLKMPGIENSQRLDMTAGEVKQVAKLHREVIARRHELRISFQLRQPVFWRDAKAFGKLIALKQQSRVA